VNLPLWRQLLIVGLGGFVGSSARYLLSGWVYRMGEGFPYGTLVVNVAGCLAIGLLAGMAETRSVLDPQMRLFLLIGLLGGFTTFSTFAYETLALANDAEMLKAFLNTTLQVGLGLGAAWLGLVGARAM